MAKKTSRGKKEAGKVEETARGQGDKTSFSITDIKALKKVN